jgi:hypothetical protein
MLPKRIDYNDPWQPTSDKNKCVSGGPQHVRLYEIFVDGEAIDLACDDVPYNFDEKQLTLDGVVDTKFYNAPQMRRIACEVSSRVYNWLPGLSNEQVEEWMFREQSIIASGNYGTASIIKDLVIRNDDKPERKADKTAIIKNSKTGGSTFELMKEAFIGMKLNKLRDSIPNFAMVFGYTETKTKGGSLIMENVIPTEDGSNLYRYVLALNQYEGVTVETKLAHVLIILLQISFALGMAHEQFDFTHYDMTPGNVMIRPGDATKFIKYTLGGNVYYIMSLIIPTIIDYGLSHINDDDIGYLGTNMPNYSIQANVSYPSYDLWRVFWSIMFYLRNGKMAEGFVKEKGQVFYDKELYDALVPVFTYFTTTDHSQLFGNNNTKSGYLPAFGKYEENRSATHLNFIDFLMKTYPWLQDDVVSRNPVPLFECSSTMPCNNSFEEDIPPSVTYLYQMIQDGLSIEEYRSYIVKTLVPKYEEISITRNMTLIEQIELDMITVILMKSGLIRTKRPRF